MRRLEPRIVICVIACVLALPAGAAVAATITVNSTADEPDQVSTDNMCRSTPSLQCTLRAAIQQANSADNPGDDTIILPAGLYQLSIAGPGEDGADTGDLDLGDPNAGAPESLNIVGGGARSTRIAQTTDDRIFHLLGNLTTANVSGVTISGGNSVSDGGGILNADGTLNLTDVAITTNQAGDLGGGLANSDEANLLRVTISGNAVNNSGGDNQGGGLYTAGRSSTARLTNVTISGNQVFNGDGDSFGGGIYSGSTTAVLTNVSVTNNTVTSSTPVGGGLFLGNDVTFANTIVALNRAVPSSGAVPSNCFDAGAPSFAHSSGHNLESAADCNFTGPGDLRGVDPAMSGLQDNGGQTQTHALLAGSPALDAGDNASCPATDQRGISRPQNGTCDIGAFELVTSVLPPPLPPPDEPLPKPVLGKTVNVRPLSGKVTFAIPAGASAASAHASQKGLKFRPLSEARQLPVRSFLNTKRGKVRLISARNRAGSTQTAIFTKGLFQILQSRKAKAKGLTELRLKGSSFRSCKPTKRGKRAQAALSRKALRRLRSAGKGRFRTRGRYSAATVRGTRWETVDRCDGTLTKVTRGTVAVRDFRRKRTIRVKRGKSYLAKAPGSG